MSLKNNAICGIFSNERILNIMKIKEKKHLEQMTVESLPKKKAYCFFKRLFDVLLSVVALLILFVPLLILSLILLIDSPGASPIYVQERCGKNGKTFKFYKLRTMVKNADKIHPPESDNEMQGPAFKMKNDPRITRVGKFLRRSSIDEFPQLWNVIKGDMSLVGPRPPLPKEVARYTDEQIKRLSIKPGITCYWQIQPKRNRLTFDQWVELDLKYISERSFKTDLKILFKTFGSVFGLEGE